jgi:hypothetical protein
MTPEVFKDGPELYAAVCKHGLEGIVAKRSASTYRPGRAAPTWAGHFDLSKKIGIALDGDVPALMLSIEEQGLVLNVLDGAPDELRPLKDALTRLPDSP